MTRLVCDVCGGNLVVQAGGKYGKCDSCGASYTLERMKEIASGVKVSVTGSKEDVEQWIALIGTYLEAFDYEAAERTVKKILEADPTNQYANELYPRMQEYKHFEIKNAVLVKYHGRAANVEIPYGVTVIGSGAFLENKNVIQIIVPDGVVSIEKEAFSKSSLECIILPETLVSIGDRAFLGCNIKNIALPNSVTCIGQHILNDWSSNIGQGLGNVFSMCQCLENIDLSNRLECIPDNTFYGCNNLKNITIPNSVTCIGRSAFCGCANLESIAIPHSVTTIEQTAFWRCSSLDNVVIPNSVTSICMQVFEKCTALKSIIIPSSVISIGGHAFYGCSSLENVVIPDSVTSVDNEAFEETPFEKKRSEQRHQQWLQGEQERLRQLRQQKSQAWRGRGVCQHCGGTFTGLFSKACSLCGKTKDY